MKITVDTENLDILASRGEDILITQEAENGLVQLLRLREKIEEAIDEAEDKILKKALEINPNFQKIVGDNLKVSYRSWGSRYTIDPTLVSELPKELYKISTRYTAETKAINELYDRTGKLPQGILEPDRPKVVKISLKESK